MIELPAPWTRAVSSFLCITILALAWPFAQWVQTEGFFGGLWDWILHGPLAFQDRPILLFAEIDFLALQVVLGLVLTLDHRRRGYSFDAIYSAWITLFILCPSVGMPAYLLTRGSRFAHGGVQS